MELPVIFLVDPDVTAAEAVVSHLSAQGWWVSVVPDSDAALRAAAAHAPNLVIAHRRAEPFDSLIEAFGRPVGGPGVILLDVDGEVLPPAGADAVLATDFSRSELVAEARRLIRQPSTGDGVPSPTEVAGAGAHEGAPGALEATGARAAEPARKFTSRDIFGDMLDAPPGESAGSGTVELTRIPAPLDGRAGNVTARVHFTGNVATEPRRAEEPMSSDPAEGARSTAATLGDPWADTGLARELSPPVAPVSTEAPAEPELVDPDPGPVEITRDAFEAWEMSAPESVDEIEIDAPEDATPGAFEETVSDAGADAAAGGTEIAIEGLEPPPVTVRPFAEEPSANEPSADEPVADEPVADEPSAQAVGPEPVPGDDGAPEDRLAESPLPGPAAGVTNAEGAGSEDARAEESGVAEPDVAEPDVVPLPGEFAVDEFAAEEPAAAEPWFVTPPDVERPAASAGTADDLALFQAIVKSHDAEAAVPHPAADEKPATARAWKELLAGGAASSSVLDDAEPEVIEAEAEAVEEVEAAEAEIERVEDTVAAAEPIESAPVEAEHAEEAGAGRLNSADAAAPEAEPEIEAVSDDDVAAPEREAVGADDLFDADTDTEPAWSSTGYFVGSETADRGAGEAAEPAEVVAGITRPEEATDARDWSVRDGSARREGMEDERVGDEHGAAGEATIVSARARLAPDATMEPGLPDELGVYGSLDSASASASTSSLRWLWVVAAAVVLVAAAGWFLLRDRVADAPAVASPGSVVEGEAAQQDRAQGEMAGPEARPPAEDGATRAAAERDLEGMIDEEFGDREREIRERFEIERKRLQEQLEALRAQRVEETAGSGTNGDS